MALAIYSELLVFILVIFTFMIIKLYSYIDSRLIGGCSVGANEPVCFSLSVIFPRRLARGGVVATTDN